MEDMWLRGIEIENGTVIKIGDVEFIVEKVFWKEGETYFVVNNKGYKVLLSEESMIDSIKNLRREELEKQNKSEKSNDV